MHICVFQYDATNYLYINMIHPCSSILLSRHNDYLIVDSIVFVSPRSEGSTQERRRPPAEALRKAPLRCRLRGVGATPLDLAEAQRVQRVSCKTRQGDLRFSCPGHRKRISPADFNRFLSSANAYARKLAEAICQPRCCWMASSLTCGSTLWSPVSRT